MANLKEIRGDTKAIEEGVWVEFDLGIRLKIARLPNPAYEEELRRLGRPHQRHLRKARFKDLGEDKVLNRIQREAMAKTVLVDWEGIDEDDEPVPYSPEKALEYLTDPALDELYRFVLNVATEAAVYREESREDASGN